jgi:acetyl-CoA C-acetyltransferase
MSKEVVIVSAARTAVGRFGGMYSGTSAVDLGVVAVKEAIKRAGIKPEIVDEVIYGNVLGAGLGQNVARQVEIHSGIPVSSNAFTINKVCASGLKSVAMAAQTINARRQRISCWPAAPKTCPSPRFTCTKARWGARMGERK